jgi:hypothetical protein
MASTVRTGRRGRGGGRPRRAADQQDGQGGKEAGSLGTAAAWELQSAPWAP